MKIAPKLVMSIACAAFLGATVKQATCATILSSATAPVGSIISQPDFSAAAFNGGQDFTDNAGPPGQTFTPLSSFILGGVTVKGFANTGASFGGNVNTGTWTITISRVDGAGVLTQLAQESGSPAAVVDGSAYISINLNTPVAVSGGTQYAFDIFSSTGYFGLAKSTTDVYAGGTAMQHGTTARTSPNGATIANSQNVDRTFFVGAVPEPGVAALAWLGLAGLAGRRARKGS